MKELGLQIYNNSPIYIQNVLANIEGYRKYKKRHGNYYYKSLIELEKGDFSNELKESDYQNEEVKKLLKHAIENSSFYKEFYKDTDIESIQTVQDLKKLPILEKEMVRENIESMYTVDEKSGVVSYTSGTSGTPLKFIYTNEDIQNRMAFLDHFKKQHGVINLDMRRASFSAHRFIPKNQRNKVFWRDNLPNNQRLYSTFYCTRTNVKYFVENLNQYKPEFIDGLPSALFEVAQYINKNKILMLFEPIAIFTTAENLYPQYRKEIEQAFSCPVRDQYASSEGAPFITECVEGNLHYNLRSGVIEKMDDDEILVTGFHTYGTPLIRYKVGDQIKFSEKLECCKCGSSHPIVVEIRGRTNDYLLSKSKGRIPAIYMSLSCGNLSHSVRRMQFIQNSIDSIEILIEATDEYKSNMTEIIKEEMEYIFGNDMKFLFHIVEEIPRQANGKFRLVINNLT